MAENIGGDYGLSAESIGAIYGGDAGTRGYLTADAKAAEWDLHRFPTTSGGNGGDRIGSIDERLLRYHDLPQVGLAAGEMVIAGEVFKG
jgi:hypothetical protein